MSELLTFSRWAMALSLAFLLGACATPTSKLTTSPTIPAAQGNLKVTEVGPNTGIELQVKNLAPPQKVDPQATTYKVWVQPRTAGGQPHSIGALEVDKELSGKLESTTALKDFDLFVTAEASPLTPQPTGQRLLWASVTEE